MKKTIVLIFFVTCFSLLKAQVNYCDSLEIIITNQSQTSVTCSSITSGLNTFWDSQDWSLLDENGVSSTINVTPGGPVTFNNLNHSISDTNIICVMSMLSNPITTTVCQNCDTLVWDYVGNSWVLLSVLPSSCVDSSLIDSTAICFMIWDPVCGCDGVTYANDCVATYYGGVTSFTPGICPPSSCEVEINGDSILCSFGNPQTLTASATASSNPLMYYLWSTGDSGAVLNITVPGTYCVDATDSTGCVTTACIDVTVQDIPIFSIPSPPVICLGDTIALEFWNTPLTNIVWIPTGDTTHMIYDNPGVSTNYIVEGIDNNGCDRRGEIFVTVDPCTTSSCTVNINNGVLDVTICDGDTAILEATAGFDDYIWVSGSVPIGFNQSLSAIYPGIHMVIATNIVDSCVAIDSIEVILYPEASLEPVTFPDPPMICLGDSIVIEVNQGFLGYWWNTGNPNDTDQDRVVVFPSQDFTYVVEALDVNGCYSREEIFVYVDSCTTYASDIFSGKVLLYPNPSSGSVLIDMPKGEKFDLSIFDVTGKLIISLDGISNHFIIENNKLEKGLYVINLMNRNGVINKKFLIE